MSSANINNVKMVDKTLVDKILEQGQKLRNSMVASILSNDPFSFDPIASNKHFCTPTNSAIELTKDSHFSCEGKLVEAFLRGDYLTKDEERLALDTVRSMSATDLCKTTEKSVSNREFKCFCSTCLAYSSDNLKCDLRRTNLDLQKVPHSCLYGYIDSLKITVSNIVLNEIGYQRCMSSETSKRILTYNTGINYFVEYDVPEYLVVRDVKNKSKIDTGLGNNRIKLCARSNNEVINIKQTFIHDINKLDTINLDNCLIKFKISYRNQKQKSAGILGYSTFKFTEFEASTNLSCIRGLLIHLNDGTPIVLGTLKVVLQLGCGRSYFGKEFIDAISVNPRNSLEPDKDYRPIRSEIPFGIINKKNKIIDKIEEIKVQQLLESVSIVTDHKTVPNITNSETITANSQSNNNEVIPLLYDDELLCTFRENYTVIEVWEKINGADVLFGLSKVGLNQFYLAYRNPVICSHLQKNKLPVIGADWWEPIYNLSETELLGQINVLLALGTQEQIQELQNERGFKKDIIKASNTNKASRRTTHYLKDRQFLNDKELKNSVQKIERDKVDIGVQSDPTVIAMDDAKDKSPQPSGSTNSAQEMIGSFLDKLLAIKQRNVCGVETGTNTENASTELRENDNVHVRKTSDLLELLQNSLVPESKKTSCATFRAQVSIISANNLPCRRKVKSKKQKNRSGKHEENILPSTYVTLETIPSGEMKFTHVVPRCTAPKWNYSCDIDIPVDSLIDCCQRLMFKVWKKSTNTVMQPNFQNDVIIGYAGVDLTVLLAGLPSVQGWFHLVDFSGKSSGQINIHVRPLEDVSKWKLSKTVPETRNIATEPPNLSEEAGELLSRTLKRKFTELDEITQRLRLRLSEVTTEDSEASNDEVADEFEQDINTLCIEEDFDTLNFEEEAGKFRDNHASTNLVSIATGGDQLTNHTKDLFENKQHIQSLLEKLTIISNSDSTNTFSNRYVSGCSVTQENIDTEAIFKGLDEGSRPNIQGVSSSFDPLTLRQLYAAGVVLSSSEPSGDSLVTPQTFRSESNGDLPSGSRPTPDGQGNKE